MMVSLRERFRGWLLRAIDIFSSKLVIRTLNYTTHRFAGKIRTTSSPFGRGRVRVLKPRVGTKTLTWPLPGGEGLEETRVDLRMQREFGAPRRME